MNDFWKNRLDEYLDVEDESRKRVLYPRIVEYAKEQAAVRVLDYGSGDGELLLEIWSALGGRMTAFDPSPQACSALESRWKGREGLEIFSDPKMLPQAEFDLVVCNLVLMTIPTKEDVAFALRQLHRVKAENGTVVIGVTHPCFRQYQFSTFVTEYTGKNAFPYLDEGTPFEVTIFDRASNAKVQFVDFHWPLSALINMMVRSGLCIVGCEELADSSEDGNENVPPYLLLIAK